MRVIGVSCHGDNCSASHPQLPCQVHEVSETLPLPGLVQVGLKHVDGIGTSQPVAADTAEVLAAGVGRDNA